MKSTSLFIKAVGLVANVLVLCALGNSAAADAQTCSCSAIGDFRSPAATPVLNQALQSSDGTYAVQVDINNPAQQTTIHVKSNRTGREVFQTSGPIAVSWGFAPDGQKFIYEYLNGAGNAMVNWFVYDLSSTPAKLVVSSARSQSAFTLLTSPAGRYLEELAITAPLFAEIYIWDITTGKLAFQTQFRFYAQSGSGGDIGSISTGFGTSESINPRFFFSYALDRTAVDWNVADLNANRQAVNSTTLAISGKWSFSPCGDAIAFVAQTSTNYVEVSLWSTTENRSIGSFAQFPVGNVRLTTTTQSHIATGANGQNTVLAPNTACMATNPPKPPTNPGGIVPPHPVTPPSQTSSPRGAFEQITSGGMASGWAYDPDSSTASIQIHIYVGGPAGSGEIACIVTANLARQDVDERLKITGNHGFQCQLPFKYRTGQAYPIYAYGIDTGRDPNAEIAGGPRTLLFDAPRERSGMLTTDDTTDSVRWTVTLDAAVAGNIEFRLCQSNKDSWGKWMTLPDGKEDIYVNANSCSSRVEKPSDLNFTHEIYLHKAKGFGYKTRVKRIPISFFSPLPPRARLTIEWLKDGVAP